MQRVRCQGQVEALVEGIEDARQEDIPSVDGAACPLWPMGTAQPMLLGELSCQLAARWPHQRPVAMPWHSHASLNAGLLWLNAPQEVPTPAIPLRGHHTSHMPLPIAMLATALRVRLRVHLRVHLSV